ncbi:sterol desaturase [Putridiphycobacter roseus]|uniref:Sterol desaturase n=1 Tax=Putridiphycobacter roseus TaxID=2219161 RepID=A0A2W1NB17_9FLAO|nr:sterol desaturase family protein [Putridiphycobacter roseus]PZE16475.1 sterol desaturase [Putridiphycobacter roseus]
MLQYIFNTISGSFNWVWRQITFDVNWNENYFWGLIIISLVVFFLEILFPWRKDQKIIRRDFWLDAFYMFFNFFIFTAIISGLYALISKYSPISNETLAILNLSALPKWGQLVIFFILNDFVQWFTHVMLHRYNFLWQFHKVHHSVKEMGFAAHLRYHWMENIVYKPLKTLVVLIIIGGEPQDAFIIHFIAIAIGHLNHANIRITWGPLKYIFNNSVMHLWHHAKALPKDHQNGVNYGISLSLWDYIFRTNYIPNDDAHIELGFENDEKFPISNFWKQLIYPFGRKD